MGLRSGDLAGHYMRLIASSGNPYVTMITSSRNPYVTMIASSRNPYVTMIASSRNPYVTIREHIVVHKDNVFVNNIVFCSEIIFDTKYYCKLKLLPQLI